MFNYKPFRITPDYISFFDLKGIVLNFIIDVFPEYYKKFCKNTLKLQPVFEENKVTKKFKNKINKYLLAITPDRVKLITKDNKIEDTWLINIQIIKKQRKLKILENKWKNVLYAYLNFKWQCFITFYPIEADYEKIDYIFIENDKNRYVSISMNEFRNIFYNLGKNYCYAKKKLKLLLNCILK